MTSPRDSLSEQVPRLRRYARALIKNPELADDLVQDTLERALRHIDRFQPGTDLRAWLFTIMHNVFANLARKASSRATHVSIDDESIPENEISDAKEPSPSLAARDVSVAPQTLPLEQRQVVLLVGMEELSYAEVAAALGIPIGTVMSRLSRGREKLREAMRTSPVSTENSVKRKEKVAT